ncbi:MAG TPA: hypothetical protein VLA61_03310 [Ideonella sp.]|uniref:hypothetical protein n=1 Tax=Ideonella sp. TaxID=1929293 RepID=UPI002C476716|nr:hypothetical protein [Ideonella sp.]HSI47274.1 hypothetical protein [Ideonella sp.]
MTAPLSVRPCRLGKAQAALESGCPRPQKASIRSLRLPAFSLAVLLFAACSRQDAAPAPPSTPAKATAKARAKACDLVTAAEMSAILDGPVTAAAGSNERPPGATECEYSPVNENGPSASLEVDWEQGDPKQLDALMGLAGGISKGGTSEFEGLGDLAWKVTTFQVFVSTRGHLMMIRFTPGAPDVAGRARRIHAAALPRL